MSGLLNPSIVGFTQDYFQNFTSIFKNYETGQEFKKSPVTIVNGIALMFMKIVVILGC